MEKDKSLIIDLKQNTNCCFSKLIPNCLSRVSRMAWRTKQITTDEANRLRMVDVDSYEEDFQKAEVVFAQQNDNYVDVLSEFFFEISNDNENNKGGISTVFSLVSLLC